MLFVQYTHLHTCLEQYPTYNRTDITLWIWHRNLFLHLSKTEAAIPTELAPFFFILGFATHFPFLTTTALRNLYNTGAQSFSSWTTCFQVKEVRSLGEVFRSIDDPCLVVHS